MAWLLLWIGILLVGALGVAATANSMRFARQVADDAQLMWRHSPSASAGLDRAAISTLPPPVRRYADKALGVRTEAVRTLRLRQHGTFRTKLDGAWLPLRAEQYFNADPPGFVWWGRVRITPGLWVDARDRSLRGAGQMHIEMESTVTLGDSSGPEMDQGALVRLLGEMTWFPSALFDERYVSWANLDDHRSRATLRVGARQVSVTFEFGPDDLPATVRAERYFDEGGGNSVLRPWSADLSDYRMVHGMLVPHDNTAYWHVDGERIPYARLTLEQVEYDVSRPF